MRWKKDEIVLVVNQDSRRSLSKAKTIHTLAKKHRLKTISCSGPNLDHTIRQALERKKLKRLVIAGGDGSVATAARILVESKSKVDLAVIPVGTANYYVRSLGFKTLPVAFKTAVNGNSEQRYVCKANGRIFILAASSGVSSQMLDSITNAAKKRFGKIAYFAGMAKLLFVTNPIRVKIQANGEEYNYVTTEMQVVNHNAYSMIKVEPAIHSSEPCFDIVTYGTKNTKLSPLFGSLIFFATLGKNQKYLKRIRATKAKISTESPEVVSLDGEVLEHTPLDIEVCKTPVKFVVH